MEIVDIKDQDVTLNCCEPDCGSEFVFTVGEAEFFRDRGFTSTPRRCVDCRRRRRAERDTRIQRDMSELRAPSRAWGRL